MAWNVFGRILVVSSYTRWAWVDGMALLAQENSNEQAVVRNLCREKEDLVLVRYLSTPRKGRNAYREGISNE